MPEYPTIEACIGNTPLVRLQRLPGNTSNVILGKLEGNNPAGSVKDRPALSMIAQAQARGEIKPGDTLIEATSGNTGIASPWPLPCVVMIWFLLCRRILARSASRRCPPMAQD